jgi:hypothetical protein
VPLALFPIAALIFLLSGSGAPVHAVLGQQATGTAVRELLGIRPAPSGAAANSISALRARRLLTQRHRALLSVGPPVPGAFGELPASTPPALRPSPRKRFRTRFGFPDGAYRATAPPAKILAASFTA